jgi:hypothetical protein
MPGYCWSTSFNVLGVLFLGEVSSAFLPSKKASWTPKFRHLGVDQQYPYPTFDVLGTQFAMARSKAHENLHKLSPILYDTLVHLDLMPYREFTTPEELKAALQGVDRLLIDATERAYHRSTDDAKQREHYSGKKTAYAEEHRPGAP